METFILIHGGAFMAKILIVEDNLDFNRAVSTYLSQYGHDVFSAYNANEAYDILYENQIDIIISDSLYSKLLKSVLSSHFEKLDLYCENKEVALEKLSIYKQLIIIVDTIFDIDFSQEKTTIGFDRFVIKPLKPSLRNELIKKWISISETIDNDPEFINSDYMQIDERMAAVDTVLGKVFGKNI